MRCRRALGRRPAPRRRAQGWTGRSVALAVLLVLLSGTATALAQPPPTPPNPSDDELRQSRQSVDARASEVVALTTQLAELDSRVDDLQVQLAVQRESAEAAMVDLQVAQGAAEAAARRATAARVETDAATVAIDQARARLDEFVAATYQQGLDTGPLGLLTESASPENLVARAEFNNLIVQTQASAQESLEKARVEKANADSAARQARDEARDRETEAAAAKAVADQAYAAAADAAKRQAELLAAVGAERADVQRRLDAASAADSGLRAQRSRFDEWQRRIAEEAAAGQRAERDAAAARLALPRPGSETKAVRGSAAVQRVIDRAMSQVGVQYVWGGGTGRGPSTGIPDAFGSPLDRIGFDCSGLMLYAFNGAGVALPRVARSQSNVGRKVPLSDMRPGDMVFYQNGSAPIHHVAMYIGNSKMIEAPYTGANVRVVPLRTRDLLPEATRVL